jgi:membrane-associated phospholipid phosphatase
LPEAKDVQIRYLLLILLLLVTVNLACQAEDFAMEYLKSYPQTAIYTVGQPFAWRAADWQKAGVVVMIGGTLYLFDEDINELVQANKDGFTENLARFGNQFGDGRYMLGGMAATWLGGFIFDSPRTQDTALMCLKSFCLANGASLTIKFLTQRERPFRERGNGFWNGSGFKLSRDSFPSGHATVVWSVAPIIAEQYRETFWVPPTVYTIAALTSYARMHDERHWASDVFAGAVIGYFTSQMVLKTTPRLQVIPALENNGILLNYNF